MTKKIGSYLIVLVIGAAIGTYFDAKHTIEEKIVYKDRVKTQIKEIITERPDGTKVTERVVHKDEKKDKKVAKKESIPVKKNWAASVNYELYGVKGAVQVDIKRRILADIYIGAYGRMDHSQTAAGVGVMVLF